MYKRQVVYNILIIEIRLEIDPTLAGYLDNAGWDLAAYAQEPYDELHCQLLGQSSNGSTILPRCARTKLLEHPDGITRLAFRAGSAHPIALLANGKDRLVAYYFKEN